MRTCSEIGAAVRAGRLSARSLAEEAIAAIRAHNPRFNAVTRLLEERARAEADAVDAMVAAGRDPGPLAGVPYGVKDLFDVAGLPTTAGAGARIAAPPATADAGAISRLRAAGAVLVATLNMDEYAYGFATINAHYGTTRNPRDISRLAGGSSGGSAAAVAGGLLPLALGSDTNGSIRVPASLTGIYGLKPTHGGLPMAGVFPFVDSFDDIGPFAASIADLEIAWRALGGSGDRCSGDPRVARLDGWFRANSDPDLLAGIDRIGAAFGDAPLVTLPNTVKARSAAFLMSAFEGGHFHLPTLRTEALGYDPATRDRLIAGALLPRALYDRAQRFQAWYRAEADRLFEQYDILLAPAAPCVAPKLDDPTMEVDGERVPARANLGLMTQPLSFIGLPVIAAPLPRGGKLPLGIQIVGKPGSEAALFAFTARLETLGLIGAEAPVAIFEGELA